MSPAALRALVRLLAGQGIHTNRDLQEQLLANGRRLREVRHGHP